MQRYRATLDTVGGCAASAIAGLALMVPIDTGCAAESSALQMTLLSVTVPRATAVGVIIAVLAAVCVRMFGTRTAWGTATVATLILVINHLLVHATSASLATANFVDSIAAGVLLGAAGAAALESRPPAIGFLLGALIGVTVGDHIATIAAEEGTKSLLERAFVDLPPYWLTAPTMGLLAVCFTLSPRAGLASYSTALNLPFAPVLAAAVAVTTIDVVSERLTTATSGTAVIVAGTLAVLAAAVIAALLLPERDGTLTLLAVALAATGSAIAIAAQAHWKLAPILTVMALGLAAGLRHQAPVVAAAAIVALGVFALLAPGTRHDDSWTALIGSCALAALAGYSFGAVTTRGTAGTVLAIGLLFIPTAVLALEFRGCDTLPLHPKQAVGSGDRAAWMAIALGAGCLAAVIALRHLRPERVEQD
ncbi:hypothetical protein ACIRRA_34180 [Nocardia sp. NPDC101769]|uniref:hypothetical protein n=1 Tax=Nocardia sp. NPDC101769 TaxID=3364333 RepID=UPI00380CB9FF